MNKIFLSLLLVSMAMVNSSWAEDIPAAAPAAAVGTAAVEPVAPAEDINYSYGVVVSATANQIVLLEYDYDRDEEVQVVYTVDKSTELNNIGSMDQLKKDDNVEVYYKEANGQKMATSLEKEEIPAEEDIVGGAGDDQSLGDDAAEDVTDAQAPQTPAADQTAPEAPVAK
jgi:hypothetical protein